MEENNAHNTENVGSTLEDRPISVPADTPVPSEPTIVIQAPVAKSNGMGIAGFVLALLALFVGWIPVVGWIMWILGLIFSCVGLLTKPRGLAIAGLAVSLIGLLLLLFVFAALAAVGIAAGM